MPTPSEQLGELIMKRLIAHGLLSAEQGGHLLPKVVSGKIRPEDWRLAIELSDETEGSDDD